MKKFKVYTNNGNFEVEAEKIEAMGNLIRLCNGDGSANTVALFTIESLTGIVEVKPLSSGEIGHFPVVMGTLAKLLAKA